MIFILRLVIFSFLILLGFHLSTRSKKLRAIVSVIYGYVLIFYTFLIRVKITVDVSAADYTSTLTTEKSVAEEIWSILKAIFGMQANGNLAGNYRQAFVLNILLFMPMGFLTLLWMIDGDKTLSSSVNTTTPDSPVKKESITTKNFIQKAVFSILICIAVSTVIETLQEITKLGMMDALDILANTIGGGCGVGLLLLWLLYYRRYGEWE